MDLKIFLTVLFAVTFVPYTTALTPEQIEQLDMLIETLVIPSNMIPGFGISIVENGKVSYTRGYGYINVTDGVPVQENSLFGVGSIAKGITATVVCKVLSEKFPDMGENVLNVPVTKLIPTFNLTFSDRMRSESISFRDLLSHRACLQSMDVHTLFGSDEPRENLIHRIRYLGRACDYRGGGLAYNNALITLAGELAAHISNMTYEELLMDFFQQVNMTDSTVFDRKGDYELLDNFARPYVKIGEEVVEYNVENLRSVADGNAAGGILASPRDMGKYIELHLNKGKVNDVQVMSEAAISWVIKNCIQQDVGFRGDNDEHYQTNYGYSLSYWIGLVDGFQVVNHGGYYPPYNSQLSWLPGKRAGVFTTSSGPGALYSQYNHMTIHNALGLMVLEGTPGLKIETAVKLSQNSKTESDFVFVSEVPEPPVSTSAWADFEAPEPETLVGVYGHPTVGDVFITYDNETELLEFHYGLLGVGKLDFNNETESTYKLTYYTDIEQYAYTNTAGGAITESKVVFKPAEKYLEFHSFAGGYRFNLDATLETYPLIPWDEDSCVPQ